MIQEMSKIQAFGMKRQKNKQRNHRKIDGDIESVQNKQSIRKLRNKDAAQRSRDRKKQYLQNLQDQNMKLKSIIHTCSICSLEHDKYRSQKRQTQVQEKEVQQSQEQLIPITLSSSSHHPMADNTFLRLQSDSQSNLSKYFWFGCFLVIVCVSNMYVNPQNSFNRMLYTKDNQFQTVATINSSQHLIQNRQMTMRKKITIMTNLSNSNILMEYYNQSFQCPKQDENKTKNSSKLSLKGQNQGQNLSIDKNETSTIIFCKSKAKFFKKMYSALMNKQQKQSQNNAEISRMQIKGKNLKQMLESHCFMNKQINDQEQYVVQFAFAILEITSPTKGLRINE